MAKQSRRAAAARRKRSGEPVAAEAGGEAAVRIRHYCQGIGDSHLIRFAKSGGGFCWMLVDCGVHSSVAGGPAIIRSVVENIAAMTDRIDILVVTHEHWDHVSGFLTAAGQFGQIAVGEVWMPWTEDGEDELARELDRFRGTALAALQDVGRELDRFRGVAGQMAGLRDGLQALLGFQFGARGERVRAARDAAAALSGTVRPRYLGPGSQPFGIAGVPNLRIFVLGPPRDRSTLGVEVKSGEMYGLPGRHAWLLNRPGRPGRAAMPARPRRCVGTSLADAISGQAAHPVVDFVRSRYVARTRQRRCRRQGGGRLAAHRRRLAVFRRGSGNPAGPRHQQFEPGSGFRLVDSGRVLLFPGDAQAGSWLSWPGLSWTIDGQTVTGRDLLSRTVYLKVAHHGSHNATLKKNGLELMTSPDLAAFVPTSEADAKKVGWGEMPFPAILSALRERTSGRVIRADDPWIGDAATQPGIEAPSGAIRALRRGAGLWVELDIA